MNVILERHSVLRLRVRQQQQLTINAHWHWLHWLRFIKTSRDSIIADTGRRKMILFYGDKKFACFFTYTSYTRGPEATTGSHSVCNYIQRRTKLWRWLEQSTVPDQVYLKQPTWGCNYSPADPAMRGRRVKRVLCRWKKRKCSTRPYWRRSFNPYPSNKTRLCW